MPRARYVAFIVSIAGIAAACGNKESDGSATSAAPSSKPAPAATLTAKATAAATATAKAAGTVAAPTATASAVEAAPPPALPQGRSAVPTVEEWNKMQREVTVKGSSALKCETKIVREYLRVSCREKIEPEGVPTSIKILRGGRGEALTFAHGGVMSLVMPFVEGTDFEAAFSWSKKSHKLVAKWPKGSKQPVIVGTFEGAASPLDGTATGDPEKLCACYKKVRGQVHCGELYASANPDCERTWGNDCENLVACSFGNPRAAPHCLPGWGLFGASNRCAKICGVGDRNCPAGTTCSGVPAGNFCLD